MRGGTVLLAMILWNVGCTNVAQMQRKYEAGDERQLANLIEIATRPDYPYATRRKAARALGEIGDPRAVPALIGVLYEYDQRTTLKEEALRSLDKLGAREAVEPIGRMLDFHLHTTSADLRMTALEVLGGLGGTKAAEVLVNALRYYDVLMLRQEQRAYRGIFSGEDQLLPPFAAGLKDTTRPAHGPRVGLSPEERGQTVSMFGTVMDFPQQLFDSTPDERLLAHASLVRIGEDAVSVIEAFMDREQATHTLWRELLQIVAEIRNPEANAVPTPDPGMQVDLEE